MNISSLSSEIFLSRDAIRSQLIEEIKQYLDLVDVDLTKSSFLSYIINIISTLTSNILFYQISVYKEFFLTKAQLDNSVLDGAASIGYLPKNATYAKLNLILTFPFSFDAAEVKFEYPKLTIFKVGNINFITDYILKFVITNNSIIKCYQYTDNKSQELPVIINTVNNTFNVMIAVKQLNLSEFEFSVTNDSLEYKFTEYNLKFDGQLSSIDVVVKEAESSIEYQYTRFSSIYLMTSDDYGYVARKSNSGQTLYFGNGLIGRQPKTGSIIYVTAYTTLGEAGNIIAGVVKNFPIINSIDNNSIVGKVIYTVSNPSPASGGINEPSLESIKSLAIDNLTSLNRLVSTNDYNNVGSLIPHSPLADSTYPVLKRSDIRTNEIQLFNLLNYNNEIVPTENIYIELDTTANIKIDKYYPFVFNDIEYITPFELNVDVDLEITKYNYITSVMRNYFDLISIGTPVDEYSFYGNYLYIETENDTINLKAYFQTTEIDYSVNVTCTMEVTNTLINYPMILNSTENYFELSISPYTILPENSETYYFTFNHATLGRLNQYSVNFVFRKTLDQMMLSNTFVDEDSGIVTVYDIPVIRKSYYDNLESQSDFESIVLQKMIDNINFEEIRMLTDFVNIKFANTSVNLKNMLLNNETRLSIDYIGLTAFEHTPILNERYIVTGTEVSGWDVYRGYIAICTKVADGTSESEWLFVKPEMDDIVYVVNTEKKYIYTMRDWIEPIFEIPLVIDVDVVMQNNYTIDNQAFIDSIKDEIIAEFTDRMVCQSYLSRSELTATIQNVEGVDHCRVIQPLSNIFYNFTLEDLTTEELLHYTPELLYFTKDNISIRLVK